MKNSEATRPDKSVVFGPYVIVLTALLFAASVRLRLLNVPLERDEGEYAYAGQLILHGIAPYRVAANMKFPGIYAIYAGIMALFGQTIAGIHLGFLLWNAATTILIFLLGRRLFGVSAGAASASTYAVLSLGSGVFGMEAHATHFVVLPVLAALLLLLKSRPQVFLAGLLFSIGMLIKQHGGVFVVFGALHLFFRTRVVDREKLFFAAGVAMPLAVTAVMLWIAGVFPKFWFWTFTYAREYLLETPIRIGTELFMSIFPQVVGPNFFLWIFASVGLLLIWTQPDRTTAVLITSLSLFSFLAVCPGLLFRGHYFVLMLPAVALLTAAGFQTVEHHAGRFIATSLFTAALLFPIYQQRDLFFRMTPDEVCRRLYWPNPFPEALEIGNHLREHSSPTDRIAVIGSEPEIYFYSNRRGATSYVYTYGLMEPQPFALTMQNEMIHEIESSRPEYVVLGTSPFTWLIGTNSSHHIFEWWRDYSARYYKIIGVAEIVSAGESEYHWGSLDAYRPQHDAVLIVFERRGHT
jgi:hypothetical protein